MTEQANTTPQTASSTTIERLTRSVPDAKSEWWREFFTGPFGDLQLAGIYEPKSSLEADLICDWLQLRPASRVLDAPCGTGRIAIELARRGQQVTAIDFNASVLERGRQRAHAEAAEVDFRELDLRSLDYHECFDAALCWWGSYGYFSAEDNQRFLQRTCDALVPGGRFLLDVQVAETLYPQYAERDWNEWTTADGRTVQILELRRFDFELGRVNVTWTFIGADSREEHTVSIHTPSYRELCALLRQAGFSSFAAYERSGKPFRLGSPRLCLVATK